RPQPAYSESLAFRVTDWDIKPAIEERVVLSESSAVFFKELRYTVPKCRPKRLRRFGPN
ncbi:hypothetical protein H0H87_010045, partial [Tephrocybe sp. NHM501043]